MNLSSEHDESQPEPTSAKSPSNVFDEKIQDVVDQLVTVNPDLILNTDNGETNEELIRSLREKGIRPEVAPLISFSIGKAELRQLNGDDVTP